MLAEGERVEGAFSLYKTGDSSARLLVFTETLLIATDVSGLDLGTPMTTTSVISRNRLVEMDVAASATIDMAERRYEWPGNLIVTLNYEGIDPIELVASSIVEGKPDEQGFGRKLVVSLRKDLA